MLNRSRLLLCVALVGATPAAANSPTPGVPIPGVPTRDILEGTLDPTRERLKGPEHKPLEIDAKCALESMRRDTDP